MQHQTPIWIWPVTTSCPLTNPHTSQSTQNITTHLPFRTTAYPAAPVVKCEQHATWPRRQTDIFFPWSLVLKLVSHVLLFDHQIQIPYISSIIQPLHQLALLNSIQIINNSSSISPPLKNNTLMRQIQHHIHSLSFVLMCDCFKHTNFSWSDHQHPMLYYTKGYTNQLKLCPTTDDYPQADSPPQPAQGPRSSKGAGGSNPKPLN